MKYTIEIAQDSQSWDLYSEINNQLFVQVLNEIIKIYKNFDKIKNIELSILLTHNNRIKKLNQEFRDQNNTTNVLSFPDIDIDFRKILEFQPDLYYFYLGDIAFSFETVYAEAAEKKIHFLNHFKHLLVHSILHLIGYDHRNNEEDKIMRSVELKILKELSITSPYL